MGGDAAGSASRIRTVKDGKEKKNERRKGVSVCFRMRRRPESSGWMRTFRWRFVWLLRGWRWGKKIGDGILEMGH